MYKHHAAHLSAAYLFHHDMMGFIEKGSAKPELKRFIRCNSPGGVVWRDTHTH
jgi:hypothetical protein